MSFKCESYLWAAKHKADKGIKPELKPTVRYERLAYDRGRLVLKVTEDSGWRVYQNEEVVTDKNKVPVLRIIRSVKNGQLIETYSGPVEWVMEPFHLERYKLVKRIYKKSK